MSLQTRIWHHFQETFFQKTEKSRRLFCDWGMQKSELFHFCVISSTKRYLFCFKNPNNFHSGRKVQKWPNFTFLSRKKAFEIFPSPKMKIPSTTFKELGATLWFLRKKWFLRKNCENLPKIGKWGNGSQKTKETVTFIRVGAMGAQMSFLLQKWGILIILRFGWNSFHFLEQNPENNIFHVLLTTKRARIVL